MNRLLSITLIIIMGLVQLPHAQAVQFTDISHLSTDLLQAVNTLSAQGVIQGYGDATFRPQLSISEKEWGLLVGRVIRNPDVSGLSDQPINRIGALYLLSATWDLDWSKESLASQFSDIHSNSDIQIVNYFKRLGVIQGRTETAFFPDSHLTRAEAAKILLLAQIAFTNNGTIPMVFSSPDSTVLMPAQIHINQNVVEIVDVSPLNLRPGQTGTLFFTIKNNGELETGLEEGIDYTVSVVSGDVRISSVSELGNGLYRVFFQASTNAAAGPVNIQISAFLGATFTTDINQFLQQKAAAQIDLPTVSLAQLIPSRVYSGQRAQILVTPQGIGGAPVSGLDISAEITRGSGTIIEPVTESPVGSGVYIGTYQASGSGRQELEITVRINNVASTPRTIVRGSIL